MLTLLLFSLCWLALSEFYFQLNRDRLFQLVEKNIEAISTTQNYCLIYNTGYHLSDFQVASTYVDLPMRKIIRAALVNSVIPIKAWRSDFVFPHFAVFFENDKRSFIWSFKHQGFQETSRLFPGPQLRTVLRGNLKFPFPSSFLGNCPILLQ